ncbi:MAG: septum formation initiator family protein [Synergistales bacterium]|nr:septum formation initiator family protein [Synergistales bacterium]
MTTTYIHEIRRISALSAMVDLKMETLVRKSRDVQRYREQIDFYSTPGGVERLAREEFNLAYPGEKVYHIVIVSNDHLSEGNR